MLLAKKLTNPFSGKIILKCIGAQQHVKEVCDYFYPINSVHDSNYTKIQYNKKIKSLTENMTDKDFLDKYFK